VGEPLHPSELVTGYDLSALPIVSRAMAPRTATLLAFVAATSVVAGCGSSHGKTTRSGPSAEGRQPPYRRAPAPSPRRMAVTPLTTKPGGRVRVVVDIAASSVDVTLSGKGGHTAAHAVARAPDRFAASLTVPRKLRGGLWPVVATYRGEGGRGALRTQVKVVTP
jgi:hypothetical protein